MKTRVLAVCVMGLFAAAGISMLLMAYPPAPHPAPTPSGITVTQVCPYEDGHPNGEPCIWTDPDTGRRYVNDSSEYRRN